VVSVEVDGIVTFEMEIVDPLINFWKLLLATTSPGLMPVTAVFPPSEIPDFTVLITALLFWMRYTKSVAPLC